MDVLKVIRKIDKESRQNPSIEVLRDYAAMVREGTKSEDTLKDAVGYGKRLSDYIEKLIPRTPKKNLQRMKDLYMLHEQVLYILAPYDFDSYCMYLEWDRDPKQKFYAPRRKQLRPLADAMQQLYESKLRLLCISMPPGVGKALTDDTPILTSSGWKKHGDLIVGDEVIGMDGKFKKVVCVHPKCECDVEVTFSNGDIIQCHENHVWRFYDRAKGKEIECSIKELEKRVLETGVPNKRGHRYILQIPKHDYIQGVERDLPLDPYTFGVWLGDGTTVNPTITSSVCDKAIIDKIIKNGYPIKWQKVHKTTGVPSYGFGFRKHLRAMGMCHSSITMPKYIPDIYLTASINQRLELLAGLIDTDGTMKYDGRYSFSTTSEGILKGVCDLISTFGWRYSVTKNDPKISSSGIVGKKAVYVISFNADCIIPCALKRKRNTVQIVQNRIAATSIKRVAPKQGNCITVEGDGMYLAGKTLIPTHNSGLALFFLTWWGAKIPNKGILTVSHNHDFVKGAYDEIRKIINPGSDYRFSDVFPQIKIQKTDALGLTIALDRNARFSTYQFGSLGSGLAGRVRAESLAFADDLIPNIEVALSEDQLEKVWRAYTSDVLQRMIGDCKQLIIMTRWSVRDPIGRLKERYDNDSKAKFIEVPAMDENGKSKFDYPFGLGYSTEALRRLQSDMDSATFDALYLSKPIEREGQLYASEELQRYFELPDKEPDAVLAICDTKNKGEDYEFMPVGYVYGDQVYIEACVCNDGKPEVVEPMCAELLVKHKVQMARFESNNAGDRIAQNVQKLVKDRGGICKITTKYTTANKETKIIVNSEYVKQHFLFKDNSVIGTDREYRRMMQFLTSYTLKGKNKHDDVPDGMAMFALYVQSLVHKNVEVFTRPF